MSSEVVAALLGAVAAGGLQTLIGLMDRKRETQAILSAIAAEVAAICALIRAQQYLEGSIELHTAIGTEAWEARPTILTVDVREDYFAVFGALSPKLGTLDPAAAGKIVTFYQCCKSAIDSHRPDGVIAERGTRDECAAHINAGVVLFRTILQLGDEIMQLPNRPATAPVLRLIAS